MMNRNAAPRVIKKYSNRRLYDTAESRYITLEELAASVRRGVDVRVIDAQDNADLTQATLTQIVLESRGAAQFLSVPILAQLIRMSDDALADFLGRWLSAAMELYQQARQGAQAIAPYNPLAAMPFAASNVLGRMLSMMPGPWMQPQAYAPPYAPPHPAQEQPPAQVERLPSPTPQPPSDSAGVEALRRELDELKRSLRGDAAEARPARAPRKPAARKGAAAKASARKRG